MAHWLRRLLSPRSIAIVGASERTDSLGAITHRQLLDRAYAGEIFAVNPRYDSLHGSPCYATLADLPRRPDLVVYAISGLALEQSFDQALALEVGGIVIYAANYIENDREPRLPERLRQKARAAGIPVCGGNSMGFYNYDDNVLVSFDHPPPKRPKGHIGLILHSGSGMTYLANNDARFCFNYVIASAQEICASVGDYMDYLLQQPSTRVIALVLEAVRDVPAFVAALQKARELSIPVVITRLGRSEKSAQLAMSHSGAIIGDHEAFVALCQRYDAILCRDTDEMIVSAMLFAANFRIERGELASMLDSGGMREQMLDLAEDHDLPFAQISPVTTALLRAQLEVGLEAVNPMDGMGDLGRNTRQTYLECGKALLDDDNTGLLSFEFEFRDGFSHYPELFDVARELAAYNDKPLVLINSCSFASIGQTAAEMTWQGIPVINGVDVALRALRNLMQYRPSESVDPEVPAIDFDTRAIANWQRRLQGAGLDEIDALELMADFAFPVVGFDLIENENQLTEALKSRDWPVVLKTAQPGLAHKSDLNGVKVGLVNAEQLGQAYRDLCSRLGQRALLMPMVQDGVEVSLGMKNDAQYGPLVIVACGGVLIELLAERSFRLAPVDTAGAETMLDEIRLGRLLAGVRGQPAVNRKALVELIVRFSALVVELADSVAEIDLNPVIVNQDGATIVDALVIGRQPDVESGQKT
ncbi:MAG: acetate--CoA ligase family protein [Gammaproteobacteria bacterium]|nr:MAG: acetate--CoA ligase family protein [Gammaproteobacteria bacterium]